VLKYLVKRGTCAQKAEDLELSLPMSSAAASQKSLAMPCRDRNRRMTSWAFSLEEEAAEIVRAARRQADGAASSATAVDVIN
jgi:hypothetical protein